MFFNSRYVPSTPPSLVKLKASTCGDSCASETSTPISDHVPELRYAQVLDSAPLPSNCNRGSTGTAATAEAVSCEAGAMTAISFKPVRFAMDLRREPTCVPGATTSGKSLPGRPNRFSKSYDQRRFVG